MADPTYRIVYEGGIETGFDREEVKKSLTALLKLDEKTAGRLFAGKPLVLKKRVDKTTAVKYKKKLALLGAVCKIEPIGEPVEPAAEKASANRKGTSEKTRKSAPAGKTARKTKSPKRNYEATLGMDELPDETAGAPVRDYEATLGMDELPDETGKPLGMVTAAGGTVVLTNLEFIPDRTIVEQFGLVSGSTVRAKHMGKDILAGLKNIFGGEMRGYTQLLRESRETAVDRMAEQARMRGANAVVCVRFSTSAVAQGAAELYAYGTAVRVE
jgi:uncharacterized protein YbjQ (UPF0145 family)